MNFGYKEEEITDKANLEGWSYVLVIVIHHTFVGLLLLPLQEHLEQRRVPALARPCVHAPKLNGKRSQPRSRKHACARTRSQRHVLKSTFGFVVAVIR